MRTLCLAAIATTCLTAPLMASENSGAPWKPAPKVLAEGLNHPWGMAFLPDGRLLITERAGQLRIFSESSGLSEPVAGVPEVYTSGQGGLLDVALDPEFSSNRMIYLSFAESGPGGAGTSLGRGRLEDGRIKDFSVIFRQQPKVSGGAHFGGRIVFDPENHLFLTLGERFKFQPAQELSNHLGTIVRLNRDGSVPSDNPFVDKDGALPEIWTYGNRNVQGAVFDHNSGIFWSTEFGPRGGDELNRIEPGANYGWPLVSWGKHYSGEPIPNPDTRPDLKGSVLHWVPAISPSGMSLYDNPRSKAWQKSLLMGGLSSRSLIRVGLEDGKVTDQERWELGARIRDVETGPDGLAYLLTDASEGELWQLSPPE